MQMSSLCRAAGRVKAAQDGFGLFGRPGGFAARTGSQRLHLRGFGFAAAADGDFDPVACEQGQIAGQIGVGAAVAAERDGAVAEQPPIVGQRITGFERPPRRAPAGRLVLLGDVLFLGQEGGLDPDRIRVGV